LRKRGGTGYGEAPESPQKGMKIIGKNGLEVLIKKKKFNLGKG